MKTPNPMPKQNKKWWRGKDVIKITANHWRTFLLGFRMGQILHFKFVTITVTKNAKTK